MKKKDQIIVSKDFYFGTDLAEDLTELRRFIIDLTALVTDNKSLLDAPEFARHLFVLSYLIEDVEYKYQD